MPKDTLIEITQPNSLTYQLILTLLIVSVILLEDQLSLTGGLHRST